MTTGVDNEANVFQSTLASMYTLVVIAQFIHHTLGLFHLVKKRFFASIAYYQPIASCDFSTYMRSFEQVYGYALHKQL